MAEWERWWAHLWGPDGLCGLDPGQAVQLQPGHLHTALRVHLYQDALFHSQKHFHPLPLPTFSVTLLSGGEDADQQGATQVNWRDDGKNQTAAEY